MSETQRPEEIHASFIERALALSAEMRQTAEEIVALLDLPEDRFFDVLAGCTPILLDGLDENQEETQMRVDITPDSGP